MRGVVTRQMAMRLGPALQLGDVATRFEQPLRKCECAASNHRWRTQKYERICMRCGKREGCDPVTKTWHA